MDKTLTALRSVNYKTRIRSKAQELGFSFVGFSKAEFLDEEALKLEKWLSNGFHGEMKYMENHFEKRIDPRKLVEGTKTVISLLFNYYTTEKQTDPEAPKISSYAYGKDYHHVVKQRLKSLFVWMQEEIGEISGRYFVDSAPVLDKVWAERSGLGWIGKHTNLINKNQGSYFFIAELLVDLEIAPDGPIKDYCGTCTKCIDACPTGAIIQPYVVDGSKCISYFTIELKDAIPQEMKGQFDNWMFGCDICQEVCPWNRFSLTHNEPDFKPHPDLLSMTKKDWNELTKEKFQEVFQRSAVKRTKYEGLMRNIKFLGNS
ncbi:tRNA epoxyqueuosine(34) reductase QueG [Parvicella tangerina]|uniref:tRNA epoxyqueuosine(34) reductase QueG n=1 Tax=Parvicella tangerina TaxID=2829795 RepID=UPI00215C6C3C|nr:tRNA epoxyqueuosine(34) reductase QueG [Parvicella tangerina]